MSAKIGSFSADEKSVICYGTFDVLHAGHFKILKFCRKFSRRLIVVLNENKAKNSLKSRVQNLKSKNLCDQILTLDQGSTLADVVRQIQPNYFIVGNEFKASRSAEISGVEEILSEFDGKLVFYHKKEDVSLIDERSAHLSNLDISLIKDTMLQHDVSKERLTSLLNESKNAKVVVIGDTIIDRYINTVPIGISSEAPVMVAKELDSKDFLGGASIVSLHVKSFSDECFYISVCGVDAEADFLKKNLRENKIDFCLASDPERPTTLKTRFIAGSQRLLRLSRLDDSPFSEKIYFHIFDQLVTKIKTYDRVIFSDFSYGVLYKGALQYIYNCVSQENFRNFSGDSQSGSQMGDISKFKGFDAIYPTENEARLLLGDSESSIDVIGRSILSNLNVNRVFLKLNSEGLLVFDSCAGGINRTYIPAFARHAVDVTGAGDTLLAHSSSVLAKCNDVVGSAILGSISAGISVSRVGNQPVTRQEILDVLGKI